MAANGHVVLVTGGSGFLGQHIVKHLQEKGENIEEVRVFDLKPYTNRLGRYKGLWDIKNWQWSE